MIEQTREIVRSFNHAYNTDTLVEPEGIYPENEAAGRLPGLDGNAKMSKSLNNGIYLADDADTLKKKVMSMYTDPDHIKVEDPGKIEAIWYFITWVYLATQKMRLKLQKWKNIINVVDLVM